MDKRKKKKVALGVLFTSFTSFFIILIILIIATASVYTAVAGSRAKEKQSIDQQMAGLPDAITAEMVIASIETHEKYGVYASVTLAQIILESSGSHNGLSLLAYECKNLFGMKGIGPLGSKSYSTKEYSGGSSYSTSANFRVYATFKQSIVDHALLLSNARYKKYTATATNADDFARGIHKAGYATDPNYASTLISLMKKYDLYKFDTMSVEDFKKWQAGDGKVTGNFAWPLKSSGTITSYFGNRAVPIAGATANHGAIDIAMPSGSAVLASDGGVVKHAGVYGTGGNAIIIDHGNGIETHYYHLRAGDGIMVRQGQKVSKGQQIGRVGTTGASTGFHLHFGIKINGSFVDPLKYVKKP